MAEVALAARANLVLGMTNALLSALAAIVVIRLLPPSAYADYATMMAIVSWLLLISEAGGNVGFSRYLKDAAELRVRGTLYLALSRRRWLLSPLLMALLVFVGPVWVAWTGMPSGNWTPTVYILIALIVVANLHGQLGYYGLISTFDHRKALLISQGISLFKAVGIMLSAWYAPVPWGLAVSILLATIVGAGLYHQQVMRLFACERRELPQGMVGAASRHGFVTVLDKLTPAIGSAPFLLLVLAGVYQRPELAFLAVASELLQRSLSLASLPMANMVMPYLHHWQGTENFPAALRRAGKISLLVMLPFAGATLVFAPNGMPLLFGDRYSASAELVLWATLPMFVEAWSRMILGFGLLVTGQYRLILVINGLQGGLAVSILAFTYDQGLLMVVIGQASVQLAISVTMMIVTWRRGLIDHGVLPRRLLFATAMASVLGLGVQGDWLVSVMGNASALLALLAYAALMVAGLRYLVQIDHGTFEALNRAVPAVLRCILVFVFPCRH